MICSASIGRKLLAAGLVLGAGTVSAHAQRGPVLREDQTPRGLEGVGVTERLNEPIPLDLPFKDESGQDVTLRDYLKPDRPIILTPVFYNCPMLCTLTLNGLVYGLNRIDWVAGREFQIVTFSINPEESPPLAEVKKRAYLTQYRHDSEVAKHGGDGWAFLTGSQESITALTEAIGFHYKPDGKGDFAHTATIVFLTPDGVIARYMNEVMFEPRDLRWTLVEASKGAIGSPMDKFLLLMCFHYDPLANSYAASAMKLMRLGGLVTLMLMLGGFAFLWWRGSETSRRSNVQTSKETSEGSCVPTRAKGGVASAGSLDVSNCGRLDISQPTEMSQ